MTKLSLGAVVVGTGSRESRVRVEARCAWCGPLVVGPGALRVHVASAGEALFEFGCPRCGRPNFGPLAGQDVEVLARAGVGADTGPAPFELLEPHAGPSITWDDVLDFHQRLAWLDGASDGGAPGRNPGHPLDERRAA